jgi:hypothetical protein
MDSRKRTITFTASYRGETLANDPNKVYGGLPTVLMRLVFLLYAEDRRSKTRSTT